MTVIQLQHLGEERLGGLGWRGEAEEEEKKRQRKVSSLVQFVCAKAPLILFASLSSPLSMVMPREAPE